MDCPLCNGTKDFWLSPSSRSTCPLCGGRGTVPDDPMRNVICSECRGAGVNTKNTSSGLFLRKICQHCNGWGKLHGSVEGPLFFHVEAGKPRLAHLQLESLFKRLSGEISVCDPYYGSGSLARLDLLERCRPIRFLTSKPDSSEKPTIERKLKEWRQQHGAIEFKKSQKDNVHDRYVLAKDELIILGHGLKDIGQKDSFVIQLRKDIANDLLSSVGASFESKWETASPII